MNPHVRTPSPKIRERGANKNARFFSPLNTFLFSLRLRVFAYGSPLIPAFLCAPMSLFVPRQVNGKFMSLCVR